MKKAFLWTRIGTIFLYFIACTTLPAGAVETNERLDNPVLEARAREISRHLRCMVCQNQSIDDSDADLARDLRLLVRERLQQGDSNQQVLDYVVARYGEFVLLKPRFAPHTLVLWAAPLLFLLLGMALIMIAYKKSGKNKDIS